MRTPSKESNRVFRGKCCRRSAIKCCMLRGYWAAYSLLPFYQCLWLLINLPLPASLPPSLRSLPSISALPSCCWLSISLCTMCMCVCTSICRTSLCPRWYEAAHISTLESRGRHVVCAIKFQNLHSFFFDEEEDETKLDPSPTQDVPEQCSNAETHCDSVKVIEKTQVKSLPKSQSLRDFHEIVHVQQ